MKTRDRECHFPHWTLGLTLLSPPLLGGCADATDPEPRAFRSADDSDSDSDDCGAFVFVDETTRLPDVPLPLPGGVNTDTLDVEMVDIDADGDLDLWFGEGSAGPFGFSHKVLVNDGSGEFTDESAARVDPALAGNTSEVEFADVDCDGDLDAGVSNLTLFQQVAPFVFITIGGGNELLLNDGSGSFTQSPLPQFPGAPFIQLEVGPGTFFTLEVSSEIQFVDVDTDGDPDILIANENPFDPTSGGQNRLLLNQGDCSGTFVEITDIAMPALIDQSQGFRPADLDGDGDTDLVVIGVGPNYVLENQFADTGSVGFSQVLSIGPAQVNVNSTRNAVLVDVNGDGDVDLVEANSRDQPDHIYLGDGTGAFVEAAGALPAVAATHTDVDAADLDGDGDFDLYFTSPGSFLFNHGFLGNTDSYFVNDGDGVFTEATSPSFSARVTTSTDSTFGDVDGDGDADLIVSASGVGPIGAPAGGLDRLYINYGCSTEPAVCLQVAVDDLGEALATLDLAPFPAGDMASSDPSQNQSRLDTLLTQVAAMQKKLDKGKLTQVLPHVANIAKRVDGQSAPPDWVQGEAADALHALTTFAAEALGSCE